MKINFLMNETFLANPKWLLVEKGLLNQPGLPALADLLADENIFGIFKLQNHKVSTTSKIAYKDVALLFYHLNTPSPLPAFIKNSYDDETNAMIAKLVSDEILSIKTEEGFVSGADAGKCLFKTETDATANTKNFLSQLSEKAIAFALKYKNVDQSFIATSLYTFNTLPILNAERINDVERFLGIGLNTPLEKELLKEWIKHPPTKSYNWIMWSRRQETATTHVSVTYKLYVSPALFCFKEVFAKTVSLLSASNAFGFKTGADHNGLARPDKFIIYFSSYNDMLITAKKLKKMLTGYAVHGVPFTAQLDDNGLISWGIDPPSDEVIQQLEGGSWRAGVAEKISAAITHAAANNISEDKIINHIQQKMLTERIDPSTWTPQIADTSN